MIEGLNTSERLMLGVMVAMHHRLQAIAERQDAIDEKLELLARGAGRKKEIDKVEIDKEEIDKVEVDKEEIDKEEPETEAERQEKEKQARKEEDVKALLNYVGRLTIIVPRPAQSQ